MQVKKVSSEKLKNTYDVTVPSSTIEEKTDAKLKAIGKSAKIKGFREGKAPIEVIKKQYGKSIQGEVLEQVVNESSMKAIEQEKITPAVPPKISITEFEDGSDLVFNMVVELFPEVPKVDYSKIQIEKLEIEQSDEDIDEALGRITEQSRQWSPKKGKAAAGDGVKMDFEGFVDDTAFPGGKAEGHFLELGSGQFIPGFEDQLVGVKAGDETTVNVKFPDEYHSTDLAGKEAKFEIKVHEVSESKPAELNDELAKEFGLKDVKELREKMAEQLNADQDKFVQFKLKEQLFDILFDKYPFEVPESMLETEFNTIWQQLQADKMQGRHTELDHKSEDEVKKDYQELAHRRVALGIMLSSISKDEGIEVSQQDIINAINAQAAQYPGQEEQVRDFYQKNPNAAKELAGPVLEEKVVEFLTGKIKLKTKKTTMKKLMDEEAKKQTRLHDDDCCDDEGNCSADTKKKKTSSKKKTDSSKTAKKKKS